MSTYNYQEEVNNIFEDRDDTYYLQEDPTWKINSLELAVWADEKIHEKEVKIAEIEKVADNNIEALKAKIEKLQQWKETASKKDKDDITFFKEHLHLYHKKVIEEEKYINEELKLKGKKEKRLSKTIKLPYRDLTCKTQQPKIIINGKDTTSAKDDEVFVAYVKANNPECIKTVEEVKWGEYKKTLKTTATNGKMIYVDDAGSPLDFITFQELDDKFDWNIKKD